MKVWTSLKVSADQFFKMVLKTQKIKKESQMAGVGNVVIDVKCMDKVD